MWKNQGIILCFILIVVYRPSKQFFSHVETEPAIPWYYQYFWGVNVSCSRKQHNDPARIEPGSPDPESDALTTRPVHPRDNTYQLTHILLNNCPRVTNFVSKQFLDIVLLSYGQI